MFECVCVSSASSGVMMVGCVCDGMGWDALAGFVPMESLSSPGADWLPSTPVKLVGGAGNVLTDKDIITGHG